MHSTLHSISPASRSCSVCHRNLPCIQKLFCAPSQWQSYAKGTLPFHLEAVGVFVCEEDDNNDDKKEEENDIEEDDKDKEDNEKEEDNEQEEDDEQEEDKEEEKKMNRRKTTTIGPWRRAPFVSLGSPKRKLWHN